MKKSQKEMVLEYLKTHRGITPLEALDMFGCFRLAAVICELRKDGYDIDTEMVTRNEKTYANYILNELNEVA